MSFKSCIVQSGGLAAVFGRLAWVAWLIENIRCLNSFRLDKLGNLSSLNCVLNGVNELESIHVYVWRENAPRNEENFAYAKFILRRGSGLSTHPWIGDLGSEKALVLVRDIRRADRNCLSPS